MSVSRTTPPRLPGLAALSALLPLAATAGCASDTPAGPPTLEIADVTVLEGDDGEAVAELVLSLSHASSKPVTATVRLTPGTAVAGTDFVDETTAVTFAPGETEVVVPVSIVGDARHEPTETFLATVDGLTDALAIDLEATVTITDDDAAPVISVQDAGLDEGDPSEALVFVVRLAAPSPDAITVDYALTEGTAREGSDYVANAGTLSFAPGETERTISVSIVDDGVDEADVESFTLTLSNPTGHAATLGTTSATGTIGDDEATPTLSFAPVSLPEGTSTETVAIFTATLSHPTDRAVTVTFATVDGTATAPSDYAATSGTLTIPALATSASVEVPIVTDATIELDEAFTLSVSVSPEVVLAAASIDATIVTDDVPVLTIADATTTELDGNSNALMDFYLTLSAPPLAPVRVEYATALDATTTAGTGDFSTSTGVRTFQVGVTTSLIRIAIWPDAITEPTETLKLVLSNLTGAVFADSVAVGTILDDD